MLTIRSALEVITGDRRGVTAIEYAIMATFIAAMLAVAVPPLAKVVGDSFGPVATHISTAK